MADPLLMTVRIAELTPDFLPAATALIAIDGPDLSLPTRHTTLQAAVEAVAGSSGGFVPSSRKVLTGTGLTGGGDLTVDRTISLDLTYADARYAAKVHTHEISEVNGLSTQLSGINGSLTTLGNRTTTLENTVSTHIGSGGAAHAAATTSVAGFMSATDKTRLDTLFTNVDGGTY